jgi:hypothetical protein
MTSKTLAVMRARIAREVRRSNISAQIDDAIMDAIDVHNSDRFWFNESRDVVFYTENMKEFYTKLDVPLLGQLMKIDFVFLYVANTPFELQQSPQIRLESASQNGTMSGQPGEFGWYDETLRLYPIPAGVWKVRAGIVENRPAPASDTETDNVWMNEAERLIRSRAKLELAQHVIYDSALEQRMTSAVSDAFANMKTLTTRKTKTRKSRIAAMEF